MTLSHAHPPFRDMSTKSGTPLLPRALSGSSFCRPRAKWELIGRSRRGAIADAGRATRGERSRRLGSFDDSGLRRLAGRSRPWPNGAELADRTRDLASGKFDDQEGEGHRAAFVHRGNMAAAASGRARSWLRSRPPTKRLKRSRSRLAEGPGRRSHHRIGQVPDRCREAVD
jgi:hypothetical protein